MYPVIYPGHPSFTENPGSSLNLIYRSGVLQFADVGAFLITDHGSIPGYKQFY